MILGSRNLYNICFLSKIFLVLFSVLNPMYIYIYIYIPIYND